MGVIEIIFPSASDLVQNLHGGAAIAVDSNDYSEFSLRRGLPQIKKNAVLLDRHRMPE